MFRHRHHYPAVPIVLRVNSVIINLGAKTMTVNLTWTSPTTRADGSPLALTDIASFQMFRNGNLLATITAITAVMAFTDTTPLTGTDTYTVQTVTAADNLISKPSNAATVTVLSASPASPVTDLAAALAP